ncbi:MAG: CapA family protein [Spirochaetia bacterium]|nr:CapA family protein [Spirochaetia bacterium]
MKQKFSIFIFCLVIISVYLKIPEKNILLAKEEFITWKFSKNNSSKVENRIILIPVVNFKSKIDNLSASTFKDLSKYKIIVSNKASEILDQSEFHGQKSSKYSNVISMAEKSPDVIGLIRLSELRPEVRVISVNDIYFYEENKNYLLTLYPENIDATKSNENDELNQIFTFAQTGVTALTRGLIKKITEEKNPLYITEKIAPFLKQFHLTHTSNEVSFSEQCNAAPKTMTFCSPVEYFSILQTCGFDIIELTGNHNIDYGFINALSTIELYEKNNIKYFGGGKNLADSSKILYTEILDKSANTANKKIAIIGYNEANVFYQYDLPLAKENSPGANPFDIQKMKEDIAVAKKTANTVIVDFQFAECDSYKPGSNDDCYLPMKNPDQKDIFQKAIDFGADIVVGTQAHQPQIIEKYKTGIIFYGLGNLFFDQIRWEGTRQGMILVHIFFKGEYKNTIVYPTYYDQDLQVYLPIGEKKKELLDIYFQRK